MRSPRPSAIAEDFGEKNEASADFGDSDAMAEELFGVEKEALCGDAAKKESDAMAEELFGVPKKHCVAVLQKKKVAPLLLGFWPRHETIPLPQQTIALRKKMMKR